MEIELKLSLPETALKALLNHPLIASAALYQKKHKLMNTYYDTPALDLHRARIAVRTRQAGRKWLQTIKCASASVGGLSSRPEWEQPYQNKRFDFTAVSDQSTRLFLEEHADQIIPVFTTNFHRETRLLEPDADTRILLMIDHGHIEVQDKHSTICEIELELVHGNPMRLFDLALCLAADLPLLPEDVSKAERGYQLFLDMALQPACVKHIDLPAQQTPLEAFRDLSFSALQAWQSNTSGILADTPREVITGFISGYDQSIKRLRFLLKVFAPALDKHFIKHWQRILRALSRQTQNLHQLQSLQKYLFTNTEHSNLHILQGPIATHLFEAIDALRQHLQHSGLLHLAYSQALYSIGNIHSEQKIDTFARETTDRLYKKTQKKYDKRISTSSVQLSNRRLLTLLTTLERLNQAQDVFFSLYSSQSLKDEQNWLQPKLTPAMDLAELIAAQRALVSLKKVLNNTGYQRLQSEIKNQIKTLKEQLSLHSTNLQPVIHIKKNTHKHH